jgi:DNA-3-methyladenine glycosylase I
MMPKPNEGPEMKTRCTWSEAGGGICLPYHDEEWGVPVHDDRILFEFIVLDGFQAGLSWSTILKKRDHFRRAFDNFDPLKISRYGDKKRQTLLADAGIIRNRQKIDAAIGNAGAFLEVQKFFGSFDAYIWQFTGGEPRVNCWKEDKDIPAKTDESEAMSRDLYQRGFRFVGPTICYAFMQAAGLVNDHLISCFRYREIIDGYPK